MKVYKAEITLESPTLLTTYSEGNILSHTGTYLPGSTVRGAILGSTYTENPEKVRGEAEKPVITFHPAYPMVDGVLAKPSHSLTYKCKICGATFIDPQLDSRRKMAAFNLDSWTSQTKCPNNHPLALKSIGGKPYIKTGAEMKTVQLKHTVTHSVGINRILGTSEVGLFYSYIALTPGIKFQSLIVDPEDKLSQLLEAEEITVRIGRGTSRGLGKARVKIREEPDYTEKRKKEIEETLKDMRKTLILRALSPTFKITASKDKLTVSPEPNLKIKRVKPKPIHYTGKNYILTGIETVSGYSKRTNLPKIAITAAAPGTLYFYHIEEENPDLPNKLLEAELKGIPQFNQLGLNILEVYGYELPP